MGRYRILHTFPRIYYWKIFFFFSDLDFLRIWRMKKWRCSNCWFFLCLVWAAGDQTKTSNKGKIDFCDFSDINSWPIRLISGGFVVLNSTTKPREMGSIGPLYVCVILWFCSDFFGHFGVKKEKRTNFQNKVGRVCWCFATF